MHRRDFLIKASAAGASGLLAVPRASADPASRQATGVKVGEVTDSSAIIWMRSTEANARRADGIERNGQRKPYPVNLPTRELVGSAPGARGRVRVTIGAREDLKDGKSLDWVDVVPDRDFSHQFNIGDLAPDRIYHYRAETSDAAGKLQAPLEGHFRTAPRAGDVTPINFTMTTCQKNSELDHPEGFHIYESMLRKNPRFFISAGDVVYYDADDPVVTSVELARFHWQRMFSHPRHIKALLAMPGYWQKDDHDTWGNDSYPGMPVPRGWEPWSWQDGIRTFREQVPMGGKTYRTARWGKTLQLWFTEGRDFRDKNTMPDGPNKTLWGAAQKKWLEDSLLASDADWKILVNPTPIVGPDRGAKRDNHSNSAFATEGREFRQWAQKNLGDSFFVMNGDRHWQYHSIHPETRTQEFSVGAASDSHAKGTSTSPGEDPEYHRFHKIAGGFAHIETGRTKGQAHIRFKICDVFGKPVYEYTREKKA